MKNDDDLLYRLAHPHDQYEEENDHATHANN